MPTTAPASTLITLALAAVLYLAAGRALRHPSGQLRLPRKHLDRIAGTTFIGFGAYLASTQRP